MALSMDEQRALAEIERRLSAEDPGLAARLSSFRRPGPAGKLRSPRGRVVGSLFTVALVAVISMMVYAMVPFRAHLPKSATSPQASSPGVSASARPRAVPADSVSSGAKPATSTAAKPAVATPKTATKTATAVTGTPKAATPKAGSSPHTSTTGTSGTSGTTAVPQTRTRAPVAART